MKEKQFTIVNDNITKSIDENEDLIIEGIANTGERDLVGDIVTEQALTQIAEQAIQRNLHLNHDTFDLDGIIGVITEANVESEGVKIKARILKRFKDTLSELLDEGVKFGLSIAGKAHYVDNSWEEIDAWDLTEISLTPIPCDQGTMGTVQVSKSVNDFIKSLYNKKHTKKQNQSGGNNMAEDQPLTQDDVIELINTAFSEQKEELLETIRKELEPELEEINKRIEALEKAAEDNKPEPKPGEENEEGKAGEGNEEEDEEGEDGKPKPKDPEEEEEEEESKRIEDAVEKALQKRFGGNPAPLFQYSNKKSFKDPDKNKSLTPREIAKMLVGDD